ncbi:alpha/beta hydrolase [Novosphingobium sp. Gsoil 351]|uniref:alpha/beta hydrolase n=1 Tax=Novosphingobium sp. Gsoil 351 TaxID=2675225 RepID=UPI0012B49A1F|nr:alpha/beta hydrolase fold domain-containing protein [Novosphingobium sp. Gsoil 351]QGN55004.1 alpha/beta hydrolase fold domain-containing protein [Novosphingobium sp. Gsoil 351]
MNKQTYGLAFLVAAVLAAPALAQTARAAPPDMMAWTVPETVSPEGRAAVAALASAPLPNPMPPVAIQRQMIGAMQDAMGAELQKRHGARVEAATIAGVPVRIVYPKGMTALGRGPVLLNLHGGGFQVDSGSQTETIPIAALTGLPVVSVLYRLAPEHPYPAALEDALNVYQALEHDRAPSRIAVYGTSAGAVLGAELIAKLASLKRPMPAALGFFSGSADMSVSGDSESWMPLPTGEKTLAAAIGAYIGTTPVKDPILSPIHGDLAGFPPTLLVSSTRDSLLSGTSIFGRALLEQGVDARLVVLDGLPHAFWAYMDVPETAQANALMAKFLKRRLRAR